MVVTFGVVQGSILVQIFGISLMIASVRGARQILVGYADDVAALVAATTVELVQLKVKRVMHLQKTMVSLWH